MPPPQPWQSIIASGPEKFAAAIAGVNPNDPDVACFTALHAIARVGTVQLAQYLHEFAGRHGIGLDYNATNRLGLTPLMLAVQRNDGEGLQLVQFFLRAKALMNLTNNEGDTAAHLAAAAGNAEMYSALIRCGADPNVRNKQNISPKMLAADKEIHQAPSQSSSIHTPSSSGSGSHPATPMQTAQFAPAVRTLTGLTPCPYGTTCKLSDSGHRQAYDHSIPASTEASRRASNAALSKLPVCPHGKDCKLSPVDVAHCAQYSHGLESSSSTGSTSGSQLSACKFGAACRIAARANEKQVSSADDHHMLSYDHLCSYGSRCNSRDPNHRRYYSHSGMATPSTSSSFKTASDSSDSSVLNPSGTPCQFGAGCRFMARDDADHMAKYSHPRPSVTPCKDGLNCKLLSKIQKSSKDLHFELHTHPCENGSTCKDSSDFHFAHFTHPCPGGVSCAKYLAKKSSHIQKYSHQSDVTANGIALPPNWSDMKATDPPKSIKLDLASVEAKSVISLFNATCPSNKITQINRIQNIDLWCRYASCRANIAANNGGKPGSNEQRMFYGTTLPAGLDPIAARGFNHREPNIPGLGTFGACFNPNASYWMSKGACPQVPGSADRHLIFAHVAVGLHTNAPFSGLQRPPLQPNGTLFDTVINGEQHLVFDDKQAYPMYLLTFQ